MASAFDMSRSGAVGAGRRQPYLPELQRLKPATTGSVHWVEGGLCSNKWDYTNPCPVSSRIATPNHVRTAEWAGRQRQEALQFAGAMGRHAAAGDELNMDAMLMDRPWSANTAVRFDEATSLHVAAMRGHAGLAQVLLHRGAQTGRPNALGQTSLHAACEANHAAVVFDLLAAGADADQRDSLGDVPLHRAAYHGSLDALITLLDYGADVKRKDLGGLLAVHKAASMGRSDAIAMLLERAPYHVNAEAANGWTPLHLAAHGAFPDAIETLLSFGADVAAADHERSTPLHRAAITGCQACCHALLGGGADVRAIDFSSCTPLHVACEEGHVEVVRLLLDAGSSLTALESMRRTPLLVATYAGQVEVCAALLECGANPTARDISKGVPSALDVARRNRQMELVTLMESIVAVPSRDSPGC